MMHSLLLLIALVAWAAAGNAAPAQRPNILFILADDLGWGDPSCYGNSRFETPALDRLAREGTLFTQFYQSSGVCSPSRCSLLTGRWPAEFRIHGHYAGMEENQRRDMSQFLEPSVATLPKLLQQAGYATAHIGKWHLGKEPQTSAGLAEYGFHEAHWVDARSDITEEGPGDAARTNLWEFNERPHASQRLVDATLDVLQRLKARPFYCQLWLNDPHSPLAPATDQMKAFRSGEPPGFTTPLAVYAATVVEMDRQLNRLLEQLDALGLAEN